MRFNIPTQAAVVLYALIWACFGINHLINAKEIVSMVPVPGGVFWIYFTGVAMLLAAIAIIFNIQARLAGYLLALMLLVFIFTIHVPGLINGNLMAPVNILKDLGLLCGAIIIANIRPIHKQGSN
ncbi:DoxX family protein [Chitinophaga alhagiae]|uniref:DoxX family protein n=1 Tax=Chitinophaga alhagiae TaxID=2203219 RepID=A0ABM6WDT0_9BACT|nr:DoxX family protein [Chitinophaga alhagiae]AWO02250.1 DoxX family protein [Chitinophaga alhagiae]